jgi:zinc protease
MSTLPETHRLANGLTVVTLRRGAVPLVGLRLVFPVGSAHAGSRRSGLAELTAQLLRRGCRGQPAHAIDEALETLGTDLGVGVDDDATRLGLTVPSARLAPAIDLLLRLAESPVFPEAELLAQRRRTLASIRSGLDEAGGVAERALHLELFRGHPYEMPIEGWSRDVAKLRRPDLVAFHRGCFRAGGACLVAAGGIPADVQDRLARVGSRLAAGAPADVLGSVPPIVGSRVLIVDKPDATQAQIRIGAAGVPVQSPELPACLLGNTVLGGGFSSRLVNEVRVERGLAYGISSSFHSNRAGGVFVIRSSTRIDEAAALVQVSLDEVERLSADGPTDAELSQASAYLRGNFQMANETGEQTAATLAGAFLQGFGSDWLERFPRLLTALSRTQVSAALQRHLPGPRRIIAVGPARKLAKTLRKFGPVEVVNLAAMA